MADSLYQIKINLRRSSKPEFAVTSRTSNGTLIRSNGLYSGKQNLVALVEGHFEAVNLYDPTAHQRVHDMAVEAAKSQVGTQEDKGQK